MSPQLDPRLDVSAKLDFEPFWADNTVIACAPALHPKSATLGSGSKVVRHKATLLCARPSSAYRRSAPQYKRPSRPWWRTAFFCFSLVICLLFAGSSWPGDIFRALRLPLNTSPHALQAAYARVAALNEPAHRLLTKLGSLDGRLTYIRLGASPLLDCSFCQAYTDCAHTPGLPQMFQLKDFADVLYALPPKLGAYVACTAVTGILAGSRRRATLAYLLGVGFVLETLVVLCADWSLATREAHLATHTHWARYSLFLASIAAAHLLPEPADPLLDLLPSLKQTLAAQELAQKRLGAVQLQKAALRLDGEARRRTNQSWQQRGQETDAFRGTSDYRAVRTRLELQPGGRQRSEMQKAVSALASLPPPPRLAVHAQSSGGRAANAGS